MTGTTNAILLTLLLAQGTQAAAIDKQCLATAIYMESRGEKKSGQVAVRDVVLNRARRRKKSVCKIIKERGQFSWAKIKHLPKVQTERFKSSLESRKVLSKEYVHFFKKNIAPSWSTKLTCDRVIGEHVFCKNPQY